LLLNILVLGEIRKSVELARHRDPERIEALEVEFADLMSGFSNHVVPVDTMVAEKRVG